MAEQMSFDFEEDDFIQIETCVEEEEDNRSPLISIYDDGSYAIHTKPLHATRLLISLTDHIMDKYL